MPLSCSSCRASRLPPRLLPELTYWQDIRPILRKNCTVCHSTKNLKEFDVSGGLALDSYAAIRKGTTHPVIAPGHSHASILIERVTTDDEDKRMPLGAIPVAPETIALLRRWIDTGAKEGKNPGDDAIRIPAPAAKQTHKRDVRLLTNAVPPKGFLGLSKPAKLELALKVGPLAPVAAVAFSPDGKLLAAGSYRQVTIWDLAKVQPVRTLTNVLGTVNDLRFSPDGRLLAVAGGQPSAKGDLRLYTVSDWQLVAKLTGHDDVVFSVAFHPNGKFLASASFDKTVKIWDLITRRVEHTLTGHSDFVYAVAFSPDGKWLVSASKDRSVKLVDTDTGKSRFTFSGMDQDVLAVAVSPDGNHVVSSGFDTALYWWDAHTGRRERLQNGHGVAVHEICFSKDGKRVVSAGADKTVRVWDGTNWSAGAQHLGGLDCLRGGDESERKADRLGHVRWFGSPVGFGKRPPARHTPGSPSRCGSDGLAGSDAGGLHGEQLPLCGTGAMAHGWANRQGRTGVESTAAARCGGEGRAWGSDDGTVVY